MNGRRIILASGSSSRRLMLEEAGVTFTAIAPEVDEFTIKTAMQGKGASPAAIASALAEAKAVAVSTKHPEALVLGSDQVLVCEGKLFTKASDREGAEATLRALRDKDHMLISAASLAIGGKPLWQHAQQATLHMRDFSETYLDVYLNSQMPDVLGSVGCYRIEGRGAQLFNRVVGDQYCIRGMPLVPVLEALRKYGGMKGERGR